MRSERILYLVLTGLLFSYIVIRSVSVPLVHDEVATYVHYVLPQEFVPGNCHVDANNHILNSALSIGSVEAFGLSPFTLRLANVLSFWLLAFYLYRIAHRFSTPLLQWSFILAILGSHYMMEFHALSRGYGISMATFMGLLYHLYSYFDKKHPRDLLSSMIWMGLSLLANLSLLYPMLVILLLIGLSWERGKFSLASWAILLSGFGMVGLFIRLSFWLKSSGALYYGTGGGFWDITLETLSLYLGGDRAILPWIFLLAFLFSLLVIAYSKPKTLVDLTRPRWLFHTTLVGSIVVIFSVHWVLGTNFPEDRVALYLYLLLIGAFLMSLDYLRTRVPWSHYLTIALLYFPLHFLSSMNLSHVDHWFRERIPDEFYDELEAFKDQEGHMPMLSGYHTTALTYFMKGHLDQREVPAMVSAGFPNESADLIITRVNEDSLEFPSYRLIAQDEPSGNRLWKRAPSLARETIDIGQDTVTSFDDSYLDLLRMPLDSSGNYGVELEMRYSTNGGPVKAEVILNIKGPEGLDEVYIPYELHWRQEGDELDVSTVLFSQTIGQGSNELLVYLWNREQQTLSDIQYRVRLFRTK